MLTLWDLLPKALRPAPEPAKTPEKASKQKSKINPPLPAREIEPKPASTLTAPPAPSAISPDRPAKRAARKAISQNTEKSADKTAAKPGVKPDAMQDRYDRVVASMLAKYGVRVRKWRSSMSGVAWTVTYRDGTVSRLIESPKPKGPMSAAVFLHEIGHHALGIGAFKPRCLEEYHAWAFAITAMEAEGLNITDAVRTRMRRSLEYAVRKAVRRGLQNLPVELLPYVPKPRA
jgi:hypothetical protein